MPSITDSEAKSTAPAGGQAPKREAPRKAAVAPWRVLRRALIAREGSIVVVTIILIAYFSLRLSAFPTVANFQVLLPYFAPTGILAAGEVFLMINGEIDLSIAGTYLLAPFLYYELAHGGVPLVPSIIISLLACAAVGLANGFIVSVIGINSFITTLGMLFALEGITLIISHSEELQTPGTTATGSPSTFASIMGAGTYAELIWAVVIVFVLQVILTRTRWGMHTIAVGSNKTGAAEAGVRVRAILTRNFVVCAVAAGLVGILEGVRTTSITPDPSAATSILLYAIAAAVIGGTLLVGGAGTVVGALIGALFLGVIQDGLVIEGVSANDEFLYAGVAILIAMILNTYVGRVRTRSGLG